MSSPCYIFNNDRFIVKIVDIGLAICGSHHIALANKLLKIYVIDY